MEPTNPSDGEPRRSSLGKAGRASPVAERGDAIFPVDGDGGAAGGEEMDMFDIELQREFQRSPSHHQQAFTAPHVQPLYTGALERHAGGRPRPERVTSASPPTTTGGGPLHLSAVGPLLPAGDLAAMLPTKQFSSVADACQVSVFMQDRNKSAALAQHLAAEVRRAVHISVSGGDPASPDSGAGGPASLEADLLLLTAVVQELNQNINPSWCSPASSGGSRAAVGVAALSPTNILNSASRERGVAAASGGTNNHGGGSSTSAARGGANGNGRSTIDKEVNDSLNRISSAALYVQDYEVRPANPSPGAARGAYNSPRYLSQVPHVIATTAAVDGAAQPAVSYRVPAHTVSRTAGKTTAAATASGPGVTRKGGRSSSGNLAHPRAVKPPPEGKGRGRGPRSQTGKNVAPSNHSAFSECSGGETRSYQSTITAFYPTNSSTNITSNTSLSSTVPRPRQDVGVVGSANTAVILGGEKNS